MLLFVTLGFSLSLSLKIKRMIPTAEPITRAEAVWSESHRMAIITP